MIYTPRGTKITLPSANIAAHTAPKKEIVTAYARVSTHHLEQADSQERQEQHYRDYIQGRSDWEYRDIYTDPGLSGTRADKRPGFMQMIEDAKKGLISKILCKSLSRFARNTIDALTYIKLLKEHKVSLVLETENIDTLTPGGEILITILAGMAEQEARNISKNVTWGLNKRFARDEIIMVCKGFLGYKRSEAGEVEVDLKEAMIVQRIFKEFLGGFSTAQIAARLTKDEIKTPCGKDAWYPSTIRSIIRNPKYCGDAIMGKTYKVDVLSTRRIKNDGVERDLFYIPDCVPPIISREQFLLAKAEDERRRTLRSASKTGAGKFSNVNCFSTLLTCGCCGNKWRRWASGYSKGQIKQYNWICLGKQNFRECKEKTVREDYIQAAFVKVLNDLIGSGGDFIATLRRNIKAEVNDNLSHEIEAIDAQIAELQADALKLNRDNRHDLIGNTEYEMLIGANRERQQALHKERHDKVLKAEGVRLAAHRIDEIERILKETIQGDLFHPDIFRELVESVTITRQSVTFHFKCGFEIANELSQPRKYAS